jgi:4-carboxymuconolactone decarboxylase
MPEGPYYEGVTMRLASIVLVLMTAVVAGQSATDLDPESHARLPYLQRSDMDEKSLLLFDTLPGRTKEGVLKGPLAFIGYNLGAAKGLVEFHDAAVGGSLNPHVRELAIMVACRETNYNLEWNGHEATALKNGVDAKTLDVIRTRRALTGLDDKDALVIRFGRQMFTDKKMDSATFANAVELFGKRGALDMIAVMNVYAVSGFFAIAVDEHPAPGKPAL